MALEALVSNLKEIFAHTFEAHIVYVKLHTINHAQPVYVMGAFAPKCFSHSSGTEYHLEICVAESAAKFTKNLGSVMFTVRNSIFNELIADCAVVQASRVDNDYRSSWFRTTVNLVVFDIDKLTENAKNFSWNVYSDEFNQLMDKTLTD